MSVIPHAGAMPTHVRPDAPLASLAALLRGTLAGVDTAVAVHALADLLRRQPPTPGLLAGLSRRATSAGPTSHLLHAEEGFSLVALELRPGQATSVHDHLTWCVVTVLRGTESEARYTLDGDRLRWLGESRNLTGSVTALTPPGDIHRVACAGDTTAVSFHVYGADLRVVGSSVRRTYHLPGAHAEEIR
jgi:predicted metal-dependent enzyme (double-stranded beta helix superfamily)